MDEARINPLERELAFNKSIVADYLKWGSVDEVFKRHSYALPISYPGFHRLLDRWGIVKAAGPNSKLSEAITFLTVLSQEKIPLERLYRSMPPSFQTSMSTLHRILHHIKEGMVRRGGTALVVTSEGDKNKILVANDYSTPRVEVGKSLGSVSYPMGYSKQNEDPQTSILRVLQQEVFTREAVEMAMPDIIPQDIQPFMFVDIVDVRVAVYHIELPKNYSNLEAFSSFKLQNFRFVDADEIVYVDPKVSDFRCGIVEIAKGYKSHLENHELRYDYSPLLVKSELNSQLVDLAFALDPYGQL